MTTPWDSRDCATIGCTSAAEIGRKHCSFCQRGADDLATLVKRWRPSVAAITQHFEIPGLDQDDIEQEGLLALLEAARRFSPQKGVPFARFFALVVTLRLRDLGAKSRRVKNEIVNDSVRVIVNENGGEIDAVSWFARAAVDTARLAELHEALDLLADCMKSDLTDLELASIRGSLNDEPYNEIATRLHTDRRGVDNALQRARRKLALAIA